MVVSVVHNAQLHFSVPNNIFVTTGHADSHVVDAVMKMWPPPAGPKDREPEKDVAHRGSAPSVGNSSSSEPHQPPRSSRPTDQPDFQRVHPEQPNAAAVTSTTPRPPGCTVKKLLSLSAIIHTDVELECCIHRHQLHRAF